MSVRRALVDCAVLSLQDSCVFYPCCKRCFSRIDVQQQDTKRYRCSKCGYSCLREQVDYRYRLSLRVTRDNTVFGVTVFGNSLNPFFGIHASGLQRLVENLDRPADPSTRSALLVKAVKDCFIGRHFIFGIQVAETESGPWLGGHALNGSNNTDPAQFIASQMILPKATGLGGCSVVSYYRILLQKAAEYEQETADPSITYRPPSATPLMIPHHSSTSSFNNATLSDSGLLFWSLQRSQHQDCTLNPTPPWDQSLGLVTSSAEQEEGCSTQESGDESSKQIDNTKRPRHAQRGCLDNYNIKEGKVASSLLSLDSSYCNSQSFAKCSYSSIENAVGNTPILNTCFSPSPVSHKKDLALSSEAKQFSTDTLTKTFLSGSVAWEDLPFSESLSEFLCEENKDFDRVSETHVPLNEKCQRETTRNNLSSGTQDKNSSIESISVCRSNTDMTESPSRPVLDITNTTAQSNRSDRHDLSDRAYRDQASNFCSDKCNQEDEKPISLFLENNKEEQFEGDVYNCSADLFSSSLTDPNTTMLNMHSETVRTTTEACTPVCWSDKQSLRSERWAKGQHSTPEKQELKSNKCVSRDSYHSLISQDSQDQNRDKTATADMIQCEYSQTLDFIPSSQSTPIVKVPVGSGSPTSLHSTWKLGGFSSQTDGRDSSLLSRNLPELVSKKPAKILSFPHKLNSVSADQLQQHGRESTKENLVCGMTPSRQSHRFTQKRRFWKPDKQKHHLLAPQHPRIQRGALNMASRGKTNHKCDSSVCDLTVGDYEGDDIIVPPTPAAKTLQSMNPRRRHTDNNSSNLGCMLEGQQADEVSCKRTLLDQTVMSSSSDPAQTGVYSQPCDSEAEGCDKIIRVDEKNLDGSHGYLLDDENEACDWSRDLFSDSLT
ncbi:DNA damage-induced apoptosis suppressor protein [Scomber japonicus]|uniref:DNA damage-induced apoptosis suppressor protein n=1 Tax=Scomber japonicus TaxID=13676 RepID=UPI00230632C4|nr:DNA damage-induced apoptosis suppressor protein [Scomber japonicus]